MPLRPRPQMRPKRKRTQLQELKRARPVRGNHIAKLSQRFGLNGWRPYYSLEGTLFFAKSTPKTRARTIVEVSRIKGAQKEDYASCVLSERGRTIEMVGLQIITKTTDKKSAEHRGQEVLRVVLNEAIREAKRKKKNLAIHAANDPLLKYYEQFGFEFNDPHNPRVGMLWLIGKPKWLRR